MNRRGLMVVDMQKEFLTGKHSVAEKANVLKLVSNICDLIRDTATEGGKIFLVEYAGLSPTHELIRKSLPSDYVKIFKNKLYFSVLEDPKKGGGLGVSHDDFDDVEEMKISGVFTSFCVRACYKQVEEVIGIPASLQLGATLNTCSSKSYISTVRRKYIEENKKEPNFLGQKVGYNSLEDYL